MQGKLVITPPPPLLQGNADVFNPIKYPRLIIGSSVDRKYGVISVEVQRKYGGGGGNDNECTYLLPVIMGRGKNKCDRYRRHLKCFI